MVEIEKLVNIQNGNWSRDGSKDIDLAAKQRLLWSPNKDLLQNGCWCIVHFIYGNSRLCGIFGWWKSLQKLGCTTKNNIIG
jgi:hypothetical protein